MFCEFPFGGIFQISKKQSKNCIRKKNLDSDLFLKVKEDYNFHIGFSCSCLCVYPAAFYHHGTRLAPHKNQGCSSITSLPASNVRFTENSSQPPLTSRAG